MDNAQCIMQCIIANMDIKFQLLDIHAMATQLGLPTTLTMYEHKRHSSPHGLALLPALGTQSKHLQLSATPWSHVYT